MIKEDERTLNVATGAPADPFVALSSLNDSAVQFVVRVWVKSEDYWDVNFAVNERIYTELPKNGVQFAYPQLDVHIKQN